MDTNEHISLALYDIIPQDQIDAVFGSHMAYADIAPEFLGFVDIYKHLSEMIPLHFTVIDFGCGYNPQSFLFQKHKRFVAVDSFKDTTRFLAPGTEFYESTIEAFIKERIYEFVLEETFAICSYVPDWKANNRELVRKSFENVFVYYPCNTINNITIRR